MVLGVFYCVEEFPVVVFGYFGVVEGFLDLRVVCLDFFREHQQAVFVGLGDLSFESVKLVVDALDFGLLHNSMVKCQL